MDILLGDREYFPGIGKVAYEGPESSNPLAFKWYDENRIVGGKTMKEHFRFAIAYWHSFCNAGGDPFGPGTKVFPWDAGDDPIQQARQRQDAAFEFITKLGAPFYCFHDRDMAPEGNSVEDSESILQDLAARALEKQQASGVKLLWGTANLFSHPRYMNGAATNPDFQVVAHAAAQVKAAIDATILLDGAGYVFWGGREGYFTLFNTQMKRELDHLGMFLSKARDYARAAGFKGTFFIEPKPMEPTKHQYDFDAATVIQFLQQHDLAGDFKLNLENNHATLAGHTFMHELQVAAEAGLLGSIDANQGDPQNGWDTDEYMWSLYEAIEVMLIVLPQGGFGTGGVNFDAKTRRSSTDLEDLFLGHIGSMDTFARGLVVADRILRESDYLARRKERYASFDAGEGQAFELGQLGLEALRQIAIRNGEPRQISGKQEYFRNLINQYI